MKKRFFRPLAIAAVVAGVMIGFATLGFFQSWQWKITDSLYVGYPPPEDIVIVAIDNQSIQKIGRWPWQRDVHAKIIQTLTAADARVIGYDVNFPEQSSEEADSALEEALRASGKVVLPIEALLSLAKDPPVGTNFLEPLSRFSAHTTLGLSNTPPDSDGILRRIPSRVLSEKNEVYPSFFLAIVEKAGIRIPSLSSLFLIQFAGPPRTFQTVSAVDVIDGKISATSFAHKIVLVGATAPDLHDEVLTPTAKSERMSGVEVHANAIASARTGGLHEQGLGSAALVIIFLSFLGAFAAEYLRKIRYVVATVSGVLLAYLFGTFVLFDAKIILSVFYPLLAVLLAAAFSTLFCFAQEKREKGQLRLTLQRYLSRQVLEYFLDHPERLTLGGEKRHMTVLFSDLRGFTSLSESLKPEQLVSVLNQYLTEMTSIVFAHGGVLDKYIGDAVMAFWNAPIDNFAHVRDAVETAIVMRDRLHKMNGQGVFPDGITLRLGVGVNTGFMVVGNMGGKERFDYTVIGDSVNVASRLESLNKEYGSEIIIAEATAKECGEDFLLRPLDRTLVKGKKEPVEIFEVIGLRSAASPEMVQAVSDFAEARRLYLQRNFSEAKLRFEQLVEQLPHDGVLKIYIVRCQAFLVSPPPTEWNGVWVMTQK